MWLIAFVGAGVLSPPKVVLELCYPRALPTVPSPGAGRGPSLKHESHKADLVKMRSPPLFVGGLSCLFTLRSAGAVALARR